MLIKILVADDSATDRLIMKNLLSDYYVLTAGDGEEAIRILEEQDGINLLILDLNMPKINGFQIMEYIKDKERYKDLRTIILSIHDEMHNEIRGLQAGAVDYIRKPIHMATLRARIDVHAALIRAENALRQKLDEQTLTFEMLFEQAPIGIAISYNCDSDFSCGTNPKINLKFEHITGRTKEELIRLGWAKITHPDDLEKELDCFRKLQSGKIKMYSMDKRIIRPDASIVWVHEIVAPLALSGDFQFNYICLLQDITGQKEMEKALLESERSKSVLLAHLPGLAYKCNYDREWTMQYVSMGCYNLTGYPPEHLIYNNKVSYNAIISPEYREVLWNEWERVLAERLPFKYEYEIITATGEKKWVLEMGQGIYNENGEVEALEGIVLDISDRKAVENALRYAIEHDRWTGLYNLEYLVSLLKTDVRKKKHIKKALIGVNLNMVQIISANYGYMYSQNLIKKAAEALSQYCNENCILFYPAENRFVFYILDYKDKDYLIDFCGIISDKLRSLFVTERIGGGIGILEIAQNENGLDTESMLNKLLIASERAISEFGKDFEICFYDEELEFAISREREIMEALSAIAADVKNENNDLYLQFQPIIDLRTGKVFGFEALARLRTEKLGTVPPLEFIPVAEKTKLILPIGEKVIIKAFRFLNRLKELGFNDIHIAINISAIQLLNPDFISRLFELINEMHVDPKNIGLEITESIVASDYDNINKIIKKMRDAGLYIAIDDFGTGHSSLARERGLMVDCMKIDHFFIDKLLYTDLNKAITGDIISMAHKLGQCTVAEGVEHGSQLQYLRDHCCDMIQGYLISKPLNEDDAVAFLKNRSKLAVEELGQDMESHCAWQP